jgi:nitrate reductase gamma subunit
VAAAAGFLALAGLALLVLRTLARGRTAYLARASGDAAHGVVYAFGAGMSPRAKESAREHRATYLTGVAYHFGIFAALATFVAAVMGTALPAPVRVPVLVLLAAGCAAGVALAARRAASPMLRALSVPDDYVANLLTDLFMAAALAATVAPAAIPLLLAVAVPFCLYLPLGKVRHCVFFFVSRTFFGAFYGRRGVFPPRH